MAIAVVKPNVARIEQVTNASIARDSGTARVRETIRQEMAAVENAITDKKTINL